MNLLVRGVTHFKPVLRLTHPFILSNQASVMGEKTEPDCGGWSSTA
jgi:hypothetical protein